MTYRRNMRLPPHRLALPATALLAGLLTVGSLPAVPSGAAGAAADDRTRSAARSSAPSSAVGRDVRLQRWTTAARWRSGSLDGTRVTGDRLAFGTAADTRSWGGRSWERATWTSAWATPGFSYDELITSWSAATPAGSWLEVSVRGRSAAGRATSWDLLARWQAGIRFEKRSGDAQSDDGTTLATDTWRTPGLAALQLRVDLYRKAGSTARPTVSEIATMTSDVPSAAGPTSRPGPAAGTVLAVPRFSQMTHTGHYPQWGGGGEAWCSPTSTSMVLGYYDALPPKRLRQWVPADHVDPWVDHAARATYDHAYDGTGNWTFNTAYAAPLAGSAFVTRLRSLREAERFIAAGIPLVASIAFDRGELDGAPIGSSNGHLLVIAGFRDNGDVVVNDPASASRRGVRRTYDRAQLERIWLEASGGIVYVIHDADHPLPQRTRQASW